MKHVDQSVKSIETWSVVLSFLKMSPKPAVTFFSAPYSNRSRWLVFLERRIQALPFIWQNMISEDERCLRIYGGKPPQNNNNHIKLAKIYNNMVTVVMRLSLFKAVLK